MIFKTALYKKTGTSHLLRGKGCEDNVSGSYNGRNGVQAIALSDGAGSVKYAATGSEITSRTAAELLAKDFDIIYSLEDSIAADFILRGILRELYRKAEEDDGILYDYDATLLCCALHPDGRYLIFHVGDGSVVGLKKNGTCEAVSLYEHDGPVNHTTFVTVHNTEYNLIKGKGDYISFMLMSDGSSDLLTNKVFVSRNVVDQMQMSFFLPRDAMCVELDALANMIQTERPDADDDMSFAILSDKRAAFSVLPFLPEEWQEDFLSMLSAEGTEKHKDREAKILELLDMFPDGISLAHMTRALRLHKPIITRRKVSSLISCGLIKYRKGFYTSANNTETED